MVHAGAAGDQGAVVCALDLSPTQLRIGGHIARSPEEKRRRRIRPEMASVTEGQIVAEPWDSKKQRKT
jgi:septum site-determining protein MinC